MEEMISKELFVEVMPEAKQLLSQNGYEFESFRFDKYDNTIRATISKITEYVDGYGTGIHCPVNINIYELAHKCKEWAFKNEFDIRSYIGIYQNSNIWFGGALLTSLNFDKPNYRGFMDFTEPEVIFKACQWILDNKDSQ